MFNEIERMFKSDSAYKKRIGANVCKRASRKGFIRGGVKTQSDFLTNKQKKALNGEVKIMENLFKDIKNVPSLKEMLEKKNRGVNMEILYGNIKEYHTNADLQKYWNVSSGTLYKFLDLWGVPYTKKAKHINRKRPTIIPIEESLKESLKESLEEKVLPFEEVKEEVNKNLFQITVTKNLKGKDALDISNIFSILNENTEYEITLNIKEI